MQCGDARVECRFCEYNDCSFSHSSVHLQLWLRHCKRTTLNFSRVFFAPILFADRIFSSSYWLLILCGWWQNHHLIPQINHKTTTTFPNVWAFKQFRHCKPISLNYTVKRCSRDFFGSVFFLPLITLFIPFCLVYWNCWPLLWWYSSGNSNTTHSVPLRTDRCAFYKSMCCW